MVSMLESQKRARMVGIAQQLQSRIESREVPSASQFSQQAPSLEQTVAELEMRVNADFNLSPHCSYDKYVILYGCNQFHTHLNSCHVELDRFHIELYKNKQL